MSDPKHTKEPWKFVKPYRIEGADGKNIAELNISYMTKEEVEANGRIIEAAPILITAVKSAILNCPCTIPERLSGHKTDCMAPMWEEAVKLAEGFIEDVKKEK